MEDICENSPRLFVWFSFHFTTIEQVSFPQPQPRRSEIVPAKVTITNCAWRRERNSLFLNWHWKFHVCFSPTILCQPRVKTMDSVTSRHFRRPYRWKTANLMRRIWTKKWAKCDGFISGRLGWMITDGWKPVCYFKMCSPSLCNVMIDFLIPVVYLFRKTT